jgi:hypothetical protein
MSHSNVRAGTTLDVRVLGLFRYGRTPDMKLVTPPFHKFEILWTGALLLEKHKSSIRIQFGSVLSEKMAKYIPSPESV